MNSATLIALLGMIGFSAASFIFALAESALFTLGKWRARQLVSRDLKKGELVLKLLQNPRRLLSAIVLGNTCSNTALVAIALWMSFGSEETNPWLTIAGTLILILFVCEVVPKTLAVRMPERWVLQLAQPISLFVAMVGPGIRLGEWVTGKLLGIGKSGDPKADTGTTDAEYEELVELAFQQGALKQSEKEIILEIIKLDLQTAGDVMRPRSQMAYIPYDLAIEEMLKAARAARHTRLPMCDGNLDTIVGMLNTRELLLNPDGDFADAIEFPSFVPESMNLLVLFKSLQQQRRGMAIVLDEYGGTAGVVTVQDILEEMIGDIRGEGEETGFVMERLGKHQWRVNGTMLLEDFRREYPSLPEHDEVDTMGGLMVAVMEIVPRTGESVYFSGLTLTATSTTDRRVLELEIRRGKEVVKAS